MDIIIGFFESISGWMRDGRLLPISMAMITTLLIVFSSDISSGLKGLTKNFNFPVRLAFFIALCVFGYGMSAVFVAKLLAKMLDSLNNNALALVVILLFIVLGFIAERKNHM
jgi:uncharacterized membrane protein YfcA